MNAHERFHHLIDGLARVAAQTTNPNQEPARSAIQGLIAVLEETLNWLKEIALVQEQRPCRRFLVVAGPREYEDFDTREEAESRVEAEPRIQHWGEPVIIDTRAFG
jgi:hypothetical protein